MNALISHITQIENLCQKHHVSSLYAFGSVISGRFNAKSDIDLIVEFDEIPLEQYADNYFDLKFSLEGLLNRQVDLLESKAIQNPYLRQNIENTRQLVYGH